RSPDPAEEETSSVGPLVPQGDAPPACAAGRHRERHRPGDRNNGGEAARGGHGPPFWDDDAWMAGLVREVLVGEGFPPPVPGDAAGASGEEEDSPGAGGGKVDGATPLELLLDAFPVRADGDEERQAAMTSRDVGVDERARYNAYFAIPAAASQKRQMERINRSYEIAEKARQEGKTLLAIVAEAQQEEKAAAAPSGYTYEEGDSERFAQLVEYKKQFGHMVIFDYQAPPGLSEWTAVQRRLQRNGIMSEKRFLKLDSLGFDWTEFYASH
ncbi:hypothetical protein THAOC_04608, partial [Thalassiosira oceanica]